MLLIGLARIGKDPVIRHTADGKPVMDLSLAMDYGKKGADGKRPTQWVSATMWGDRVEKLQSHLVKGQSLFVTLSEPHLEEYKRKDGTTGTSLRARLNELEFAGAPKDKVRDEPKENFDSTGLIDDIPF